MRAWRRRLLLSDPTAAAVDEKGRPFVQGESEKYTLPALFTYEDQRVTESGKTVHRFRMHDEPVNSGMRFLEICGDENHIKMREHVPIAEKISRAQKAFLTIELDYGRRFSYDAFMEFRTLRMQLRQLLVISQTHCGKLDEARLNVRYSAGSHPHPSAP